MHPQKCPTRGLQAAQEHLCMDLHTQHLPTCAQIECICTLGDGWQAHVHTCSKALFMVCCKHALRAHTQSWRGICSDAAWMEAPRCSSCAHLALNLSLGGYPGRYGNRSLLQQRRAREKQRTTNERARRCVPELCVLLLFFFSGVWVSSREKRG